MKWYIGKSRMGKSKAMEYEIRERIAQRQPVCVLDPHGELYEGLVEWLVNLDAKENVFLLDPAEDTGFRFNPLPSTGAVDFLVRSIAHIFGGDTTRIQVERLLRMIFYAVAEQKRPFVDAKEFLKSDVRCMRPVKNEMYADLWEDANAMPARSYKAMMFPIQTRLLEFFGNPVIYKIFSSVEGVNFFDILSKGVFLVNLSQNEKVSDANRQMLGILLINAIFYFAQLRGTRWNKRRPFHVFIDEFYLFVTEDINNILDQAGKFGLELYLAHQRFDQVNRNTLSAIKSRADERYVFRIEDPDDAAVLAKAMFHFYEQGDLQRWVRYLRGLERRHAVWYVSDTGECREIITPEVYKFPCPSEWIRRYKQEVYLSIEGESIAHEEVKQIESETVRSETVEKDDDDFFE
jgi:hypothetical protein